ncbi:MAG: DUF1684 domain-containing protein [Gemmatimonadales bacterium]
MRALVFAVASLFPPAMGLVAQSRDAVARERSDFLSWLTTAPNSPLAAVARHPVGAALRLGPPDADIPLSGIGEHRILAKGRALVLKTPSGSRPVSRDRPIRLGSYTLYLTGPAPGTALTVFGQDKRKAPPGYHEYDPTLVFSGPLLPPGRPGKTRVLAADGTETEATEAGSIVLTLGAPARLRVLRIASGGEESELEIFFRDQSNGQGTYPAGRFVSLIPLPNGHYRLDFNRARNPFCAYSAVYPCPAPWRGNVIAVSIRAGERYSGGGLQAPPAGPEVK